MIQYQHIPEYVHVPITAQETAVPAEAAARGVKQEDIRQSVTKKK